IFTVSRHPDSAAGRERAESWAAKVAAGTAEGVLMRYATTTGTVLIRWDGAPPADRSARRATRARAPLPPCLRPGHEGVVREVGGGEGEGGAGGLGRA